MSFGLTAEKIILLVVLAALIIGPSRLPDVAARLGNVVRALRRLASNAEGRLREELGPEFDEVDWRRLDPRRYDPRQITRAALEEDGSPPAADTRATSNPRSSRHVASTRREPPRG